MSRYLRLSLAFLLFCLLSTSIAAQTVPLCPSIYGPCGDKKGDYCKEDGVEGTCQNEHLLKNVVWSCICECPDPGATVTLKSLPITTLPATRIFVPAGNVALTQLTPSPLTLPMTGGMTVHFQEAGDPPTVTATIRSLFLFLPSIQLPTGEQTGPTTVTTVTDLNLTADVHTGATTGTIKTIAFNSLGKYKADAAVKGNLDFATGEWTLTTNVCAIPCANSPECDPIP